LGADDGVVDGECTLFCFFRNFRSFRLKRFRLATHIDDDDGDDKVEGEVEEILAIDGRDDNAIFTAS
jgi:hypothetical protein